MMPLDPVGLACGSDGPSFLEQRVTQAVLKEWLGHG